MKSRSKSKCTVSDKIADALTVKPRLDIEDDHVFGTKPQTVSRDDLDSSGSEEERAISNFRKTNASLLSEISTKYAGEVVSRKDLNSDDDHSDQESSDEQADQESNDYEETAAAITESKNTDTKSDSDCLVTKATSKNGSLKNSTYEGSESSIAYESSSNDSEESDNYSISKFQTLLSKKISNQISSDPKSNQYKTLNSKTENNDALSSADSDNASDSSTEGDDEEEGEGIDISQIDQLPSEDFEHMKKQNIPEEVKKGMCVKNQLMLWENFLEMRIHLQRCLSTANQMPLPNKHKELKSLGNKQFNSAIDTAKNSITNVLNKLLSLQHKLLENYPDTKNIGNLSGTENIPKDTKEDDDEVIPSDTDNEEIPSDSEPEENGENKKNEESQAREIQKPKKRKLGDYELEISATHKKFLSFRNETIQKWNDKTRSASTSTLKNTVANPILSQIDYILSDKEKLVKKTQLKRTDFDIVGYEKQVAVNDGNNEEIMSTNSRRDDDEYISEIFDDSDFYHQLLRELIEFKSADISDPIQLSRQWIALQQMRSKMKKKVDTKATKGRKIKYVVHNKLVNFMGPEKIVDWTDESRNELYSSLFGKKYENVEQSMNVNESGFKIMT